MDENKSKKTKNWLFLIIIFVALAASAFVITANYIAMNRLVQFTTITMQERVMEIDEPVAEEPEPVDPVLTEEEKEIRKIAYCIQSLQPRHSFETAEIIAKHAYYECKARDISIALWVALMFVESSLNPMLSSSAGALGLSQVRYSVWKEQPELLENGIESRHQLFWVNKNIRAGTSILKKYYDESGGKIGVALWRYNSGQPRLPEGKAAYDIGYVNKIMFYTYKVDEMMRKIAIEDHPVYDADARSETE